MPGLNENLRTYLAHLSKISGITFKHGDRPSRQEAQQLLGWSKTLPHYREVMLKKSHPAHARALQLQTAAYHFAYSHPVDANGDPAPLDQAAMTIDPVKNLDGALTQMMEAPAAAAGGQLSEHNPFRHMTPEKAREHIDWAMTQPQFMAAVKNPKHPQHDAVMFQWGELHDVAHGAGALEKFNASLASLGSSFETYTQAVHRNAATGRAVIERALEIQAGDSDLQAKLNDPRHRDHTDAVRRRDELAKLAESAGITKGSPTKTSPTTEAGTVQDQIAAKYADKDFMKRWRDKRDPGHAAAIQEMSALYEKAHPSNVDAAAADRNGGGNASPDQAAPTNQLTPKEQIDAKRGDANFMAAYGDGRAPGHAAAVREMTSLYERAHPSPAAPRDWRYGDRGGERSGLTLPSAAPVKSPAATSGDVLPGGEGHDHRAGLGRG